MKMMLVKMGRLYLTTLILGCFHYFALSDFQGEALIEFKNALKATHSQLPSWTATNINTCSSWSNIVCNGNNVTTIFLQAMGFNGTLSSSIVVLQSLSTLRLEGNHITGEIPEGFGNLKNLVTLNLENNSLAGQIPSSMGNLKKLQFLTLSQNHLTGTIPETFSTLTSLINLSLDSNDLSGQIPEQLFQVSKFNFSGNKLDCGKNSHRSCISDSTNSGVSKKSMAGLKAGLIAGLIVALLLVGFLFFLCNCRHNKVNNKGEVFADVPGEIDQKISFGQLKRFSWRELQLATEDFSEENVIGQGGFGRVYKGVLTDGTKVAVKQSTNYKSPGEDAAFLREVEMISVAVHRNILRLIGFCTTETERLLVYPFMQNLSVAYHLRELKPEEPILEWSTRKRVALGAARGLGYLHEHCNPKIIHRDVKAANVLLDEEFEAVVGDFGLAKLVDVRKTNVTTQVRGTAGHIAPEYLSTGKSSEKTDVFGYGIMLLELVTGQRAMDLSRLEGDDVLLLDHVKKLVREKRLNAIVDENLNNYDIQEVELMTQVAILCTQLSSVDRPTMSQVIRMLEGEGLGERWEEWQNFEVTRKQEYERMQRRFALGDDSTYKQEPIQLSGGR